MKQRCQNKNRHNYLNYTERGITVCERWQSFDNFIADMGPRPEGHSLDRIDNEMGYFPENCRWATPLQQTKNRSGYSKLVDRTGQKFDHLTFLNLNRIEGGRTFWNLTCDCGSVTVAVSSDVVRGHTKSCGCKRGIKMS